MCCGCPPCKSDVTIFFKGRDVIDLGAGAVCAVIQGLHRQPGLTRDLHSGIDPTDTLAHAGDGLRRAGDHRVNHRGDVVGR